MMTEDKAIEVKSFTIVKHETLAEALLYAQSEYPEIKKNKHVEFEGTSKSGKKFLVKYDYAELPEIKRLIEPCLHRHGLVINTRPVVSEAGKLSLQIEMKHTGSKEVEKAEMPLPDGDGDMKELASNMTYLTRYMFCAITGVVAEADIDAQKVTRKGSTRKAQPAQDKQKPTNGNGNNGKAKTPAGQDTQKPEGNGDTDARRIELNGRAHGNAAEYGMTPARMKDEWISRMRELGKSYTSRTELTAEDWQIYITFMDGSPLTSYQEAYIEAVVTASAWGVVGNAEFLGWAERSVGIETLESLGGLSRLKARNLMKCLGVVIKKQKLTIVFPDNPAKADRKAA